MACASCSPLAPREEGTSEPGFPLAEREGYTSGNRSGASYALPSPLPPLQSGAGPVTILNGYLEVLLEPALVPPPFSIPNQSSAFLQQGDQSWLNLPTYRSAFANTFSRTPAG